MSRLAWLRLPWLFNRRVGVALLWTLLVVAAAVAVNIPCVTTVQGASAAVQGIEAGMRGDIGVRSLQELHSAIGQHLP
mgnify:CR=1 FL=1